jgi:hypothetical protein
MGRSGQGRLLTSLGGLELNGDVANLLVGSGGVTLALLQTRVQVCDVSLVDTDTSVLVLDLNAQAVESSDMLVTLQLSGVEHRAKVVGVTLESVVLVGPLLEVPDGITVSGVGALELVFETALLVKELCTLVLEDADALVGVGDLLVSGIEKAGEVGVPALVVSKLSGNIAEVAAESLDIAESVVTLGVGIVDLSVLRLELSETSVVVKLEARKLRLQGGVVLTNTVLKDVVSQCLSQSSFHHYLPTRDHAQQSSSRDRW